MAKPYREPTTSKWSFRLRVRGEDIYRTGFKTEIDARKAQEALRQGLQAPQRQALAGPWKTTLAETLLDYALERLPGLKSGDQESRRINRYLRLAEARTLKLTPIQSHPADTPLSTTSLTASGLNSRLNRLLVAINHLRFELTP